MTMLLMSLSPPTFWRCVPAPPISRLRFHGIPKDKEIETVTDHKEILPTWGHSLQVLGIA